jgi:hypothetical protein
MKTSIVILLTLAATLQAAVVYDSTSPAAFRLGDIWSTNVLDDAVSAFPSPMIGKMRFGVENTAVTSENVDAIITFWDTVNPSASPVNSEPLLTFRYPIGAVPPGEWVSPVFFMPTAVTVADSAFGVQIFVVGAGTETPADGVFPLLALGPAPITGTTAPYYWSDTQGTPFVPADQIESAGEYANLYLHLDIVPEPRWLVAGAAVILLGRRRR